LRLRRLACCRDLQPRRYDEGMSLSPLMTVIAVMVTVFAAAAAKTVTVALAVCLPMPVGADMAATIAEVDDHAGAVIAIAVGGLVGQCGRRSQSRAQSKGEELSMACSHDILHVVAAWLSGGDSIGCRRGFCQCNA